VPTAHCKARWSAPCGFLEHVDPDEKVRSEDAGLAQRRCSHTWEYRKERLAEFEDLLRRCLRGSHNCEPVVLTRQQCRDIRRLHREFRNNFVHFIPTGWGIEKVGLPRIIGAALDVVEDLMNRRQGTYRMEEHQREQLSKTLHTARLALGQRRE
jgi:hypothetical protein